MDLAKARDLTIFNVVTGLAAVHYLLKTQGTPLEPTTWVYIIMWVLSLVMLLWLRVYGNERGDLVDYEDDLLYNFVLVAPAEENVKLMGMLALYRKTQNELLSVGLPVGVWAALHAYHAYLGEVMPILVASAFLSGLILFAVLKYTQSLENAIISHGLYNSLVVLTSFI